MSPGRCGKLLLSSLAAASVGFCLYKALGLPAGKGLLISAGLVLAAAGTVLLVYGENGKLERPKLLAAIVAAIIAICIGLIALVWYALAHSTDL